MVPFSSWENALLSVFQHLIDHTLSEGKIFLVICGSYMGFMEKEVLGTKSPLFGRRTGQLHMRPFDYYTAIQFLKGFPLEEQFMLYGAYGGTAMYLQQVMGNKSLRENIIDCFLNTTGYLYEEPLLLLRQEVREPGIYSVIIEAIAGGASKSNEIATKSGEPASKCLKYIHTLCELGIIHKEVPFGEKENSRKTIYCISDFMFRFWYRYVSSNKTLLETDAQQIVWKQRIEPDYNHYMDIVFEEICKEYLLRKNSTGELPILFTRIGRWWGMNSKTRVQEEIDLIAQEGDEYLFCECKWRNEVLDYSVLEKLKERADVYCAKRSRTWFFLFSKSGFSEKLEREAEKSSNIMLIVAKDMI